MLYLAYGMNTNVVGMGRRCPAAKPVGSARLTGYELVFRGVADLAEKADATVYGAVWDITPACEKALDMLEGYPTLYTKKYVLYAAADGTTHPLMFYVMNGHKGEWEPSRYYEALLRGGYSDFGLPVEQLNDAITRAQGAQVRAMHGRAKRHARAAERAERKRKAAAELKRRGKMTGALKYGPGDELNFEADYRDLFSEWCHGGGEPWDTRREA